MTINTIQTKLKEIRIIVNSDLPINFDKKVIFEKYEQLVYKVIELVNVNRRLGIDLPVQLITVAEAKEKDYITVKEFELLYSYGSSWQKDRRSRIHNPLPTVSSYRMKILYDHQTVKEWLKNEIFK